MAERQRDCASLRLSIEASSERTSALKRLQSFFVVARQHEFAEIRVDRGRFPSLGVLVHDHSACLMYLRYDGDAGFSSRNMAYSGPRDLMIEFMLSNGQVDEHSASWAYPTETAFDALFAFAREGRVPHSMAWFNDSGDGAAGPNDTFDAPR